jgi:glycosyltransferase involved in cell wall biosynthesis
MSWREDGAGSGVERVYHGLFGSLPAQHVGFQGLAFAPTPSAAATEGVHLLPSPAETSSLQRLYALRRRCRSLLRETPPDLVASHFSLHALPVLDLLSSIPLVVHFHGPWALESAAEGESTLKVEAKRWIEHLVYRRATRFVVLSGAFRDVLTTHYGVDPARIRCVPGGVDVERFRPSVSKRRARLRLGWAPDRPTLFSARRLVHRVGLLPLVDAMQEVVRHVPDAQLFIAGKGPLAPILSRRIAERGLEDHVVLLGFLPEADLPLAYRAADLSVVPTQSLEGFGLVAAESLSAGTPPLVTPVGGLPEVVSGLSSTLVFDAASPAAMADRLVQVLRGGLPLPSTADCRAYALNHFSWERIAQQTRSVYEEVL